MNKRLGTILAYPTRPKDIHLENLENTSRKREKVCEQASAQRHKRYFLLNNKAVNICGGRFRGFAMPRYASPAYWESVYSGLDNSTNPDVEWYLNAEQLSPFLWPLLSPSRPTDVLEVGCGTQPLLPGLRALRPAAFGRLLATDVSPAGIARLSATIETQVECAVSDCRAAPQGAGTGLASQSFDLVLDKGTCDALICSEENGHADVAALASEAARLLRSQGALVVITHYQPDQHLSGEGPDQTSDARPLISALLEGLCAQAPEAHWGAEAHVPDPDDCPRVLIFKKVLRRVSRGRSPLMTAPRDVRCRLLGNAEYK